MHSHKHLGQNGMVSIVITMIMMLVISLIVIGVAQVTRHGQQEALDRQLSSQAFYAAESGVNDAVSYLQGHLGSLPPANTDNCNGFISNAGLNPKLTADGGVSYTCLKVNPTPPVLTVSPAGVSQTTVWPLMSASGQNWRSFTFTWNDHAVDRATKTGACPAAGSFPTAGSAWPCSYGILRLDLVSGFTMSPSALEDPTQVGTYYLVPQTSGGVSTITAANGPTIAGVKCANGSCSVTIGSLNILGRGASNVYYARLTMLYEDSDSVSVSGTLLSGATENFKGGQAIIDSTGRAQDVLRRVKVVVPLTGSTANSPLPLNALQTTSSLCKYFTIVPGASADYSADSSAACNYHI